MGREKVCAACRNTRGSTGFGNRQGIVDGGSRERRRRSDRSQRRRKRSQRLAPQRPGQRLRSWKIHTIVNRGRTRHLVQHVVVHVLFVGVVHVAIVVVVIHVSVHCNRCALFGSLLAVDVGDCALVVVGAHVLAQRVCGVFPGMLQAGLFGIALVLDGA
jgi:hypothetical protein